MISSDIMRGFNDMLVLALLYEHDSYGYQLSQDIFIRSGRVYPIKETTLYSALNRLEESGYIVAYAGAETFGRPRTYFKLTNTGKQYLSERINEWNVVKTIISNFMEGV